MRTPLEQSILDHIRTERMMSPGDRIAVAVSGGGDSVALLRILVKIRSELGVALAVAHFDHALRGAESDRDARFVEELARTSHLELFAERADLAAEAKLNGWNLEDAARRLRYAFFQGLVACGKASRVAVAHTADDQAETVLAHIMRGTGPTGLAGIYPATETVVRPLLRTRRRDLRSYLEEIQQTWCEDSTNQDEKRLRSRIRAQLLPKVELDFSPRIVEHLSELARLSREDVQFWDALVEERCRTLVRTERIGEGENLVLSVRDLLDPFRESPELATATGRRRASHAQPWLALTERIVRRLYQDLKGDRRQLTSRHVDQVIRLARNSISGRAVVLPGGIRVERRFEHLVLSAGTDPSAGAKETKSQPNAYQYCVDLETIDQSCPSSTAGTRLAVVDVPEIGVRFRLKRIDWAKTQRDTKGENPVLDANSLSAPLILRSWRPGDAYTPHGRSQPKKLKQMFVAARIPSEARLRWPVLESAGRVVWARGMPAADAFCASDRTLVGVVIEEEGM
jgi:tRNA(Ile)-lysidine synthase